MSPLVKPTVSSFPLKLQMRFWCYREVSALAVKNLRSGEFLKLCIAPCILLFTALASPRFLPHSHALYYSINLFYNSRPTTGATFIAYHCSLVSFALNTWTFRETTIPHSIVANCYEYTQTQHCRHVDISAPFFFVSDHVPTTLLIHSVNFQFL
ncbi:hypothetical protein EV702DRAFT_792664 [Suillus placidus]|uniref:Uncharacterized protein n=1 Tax=Suillus placidus TaxID=48579 RepID=A0A9P6ZHD1_9AGAM|nr:hypothetical protein EV702DRAFT_792664 [Suillus placidus]